MEHQLYLDKLSTLQHRLQSHSHSGRDLQWWSSEAELLTAELTEKEIHLHQIEVQAEMVLKSTSPDGRKYVEDEVEQLQRMWTELNKIFRTLYKTNITRNSSTMGENTSEFVVKSLRSCVYQGQKLFEQLINAGLRSTNTEDQQLENLRYRWMLYKSKLSKAEGFSITGRTEVTGFRKKSSGGMCHYLYRACCAALPLQLFLLFLLLLAFLLPLIQEHDSCSLVNNFVRSFYLMLWYQSPPPT